jgi:hypothetical protein
MKNIKLLAFLVAQVLVCNLFSQISFSNQTNLLGSDPHFSGVCMAVSDMNGDGLDDLVRLEQGTILNIQYQSNPNEVFINKQVGTLPNTTGSQWGMCVADIDNNGFGDVLAGGYYDAVKIAKASTDGTNYSFTLLNSPLIFTQGVNLADINNDGLLDVFACHDDGASKFWGHNANGSFSQQATWINLATSPASDNSGNYGSIWSDVNNDGLTDLYIAHCRQGVTTQTDPRRINQLFINNGNGTYSQDITNTSGLRINWQSWTADFGDIDNDGDLDCFVTNHDYSSQLLQNDGAGHFTDISSSSGIFSAVTGTPIQGVFRDFDNDGYVDILVAGSAHHLFRNNHNRTFTKIANPFSNNMIESFAIGDLNNDGFQDVYAGYGTIYTNPSNKPDILWMNNGNNNHYFGVYLRGVQSNKNGIGAKVQLYSSLGIQTREAHAGESYGISNSPLIHFGLGQVESIDSVVVKWPSGLRQVVYNPVIDQYATLIEGGCLIPSVRLTTVGSSILCPGDSLSIEAPAGYNYTWSNGDTSKIITVKSGGDYRVTISSSFSCSAVSNTIHVIYDPAIAPVIDLLGDSILCSGSSLTLMAPPSLSYLWSTGESTQSIQVNREGQYSVITQGYCVLLSSSPVNIHLLPTTLPGGLDLGLPPYDSAALWNATNMQQFWFNSPTDPTPLPMGNPLIMSPDSVLLPTYWVANITTYDQPNQFVGMKAHQGSLQSDNSYNGGLLFDCQTPFALSKAKVYATVDGERRIDLYNSDMILLDSKTVFIPSGEQVIELGFHVPVGSDFLLTTDIATNNVQFGTNAPQLRRSTQGVEFPYSIPKYLSIKNSTIDETRYFYFYDWEIDFYEYHCESPRIQVNTAVNPSSAAHFIAFAPEFTLFPNPSSGLLNLQIKEQLGQTLTLSILDSRGIVVLTKSVKCQSEEQIFKLETVSLPSGVYWLQVAGAGGVSGKQVIIR